jgi:hypothetical protein
MKKTMIIAVTLLSLAFTMNAQIWKLESYSVVFNHFENNESNWTKPQECSAFVIIDLDNNRIVINNKDHDKFSILSAEDQEEDVDNYGDKYVSVEFSLYDQNGVMCTGLIKMYDKVTQVLFFYSNFAFGYIGNLEQL